MSSYEEIIDCDIRVSRIKTVAVFTYPTGWQITMNNKENAALYYVTEGEFSVEVGGKQYTASKNHFITLCEGQDYVLANRSDNIVRTIHFTFYTEEILDFRALNIPVVMPDDENEKYLHRFLTALKLYWDRPAAYLVSIRSKLDTILYELIQDVNSNQVLTVDRAKKVVEITCDYIENNYRNPISLEDICRQANYSPSRLRFLFCREMDCSPMHYLYNYRLNEAKKLIAKTRLSIEEIAIETGFSCSSHFCHYFKEKCGCTPSEYRAAHTKKTEM